MWKCSSVFFPALVLGIVSKRATGLGAVAGTLRRLGVTFCCMSETQPWLRELFWGLQCAAPAKHPGWKIEPISAGVSGIPVFLVLVVSLITP